MLKKLVRISQVFILILLGELAICINWHTSGSSITTSSQNDPRASSTSLNFDITNRTFLIGMNPITRDFGLTNISTAQAAADLNESYTLGKSTMELYPRWPEINWYDASIELTQAQMQLYTTVQHWQPMIYVSLYDYYLAGMKWSVRPLYHDLPTNLHYNSSEFVSAVADSLAQICKYNPGPKIIFLGNEINQLYELTNKSEFLDYCSGIDLICRALHANPSVPSDVLIGTVLSHTQMLVNTSNDQYWSTNRLWMLKTINQTSLDIVGINTYPFETGYASPVDIPPAYYTNITGYISKPIWFTEIGWPSGADYNSSTSKQATFLSWFINDTRSMKIQAVCWASMHDFANASIWENYTLSWGLRDKNSVPKEAWDLWTTLKAIPVGGAMEKYLVSNGTPVNITMAQIFLIIILGTIGIVVVLVVMKIIHQRKKKKYPAD